MAKYLDSNPLRRYEVAGPYKKRKRPMDFKLKIVLGIAIFYGLIFGVAWLGFFCGIH